MRTDQPQQYNETSTTNRPASLENEPRQASPGIKRTPEGDIKGIISADEVCPHERQGTDYDRNLDSMIAMPIAIIDGIYVTDIVSYSINLNNKENSNIGNIVLPIDLIDPTVFLEFGKKHVVEIYAGYVYPEEVEKFKRLSGKERSNSNIRVQPAELPKSRFGFRFCGFVDYPEWQFDEGILQLVLMDFLQLLNETTVSDTFVNRSPRYILDKIQNKIARWGLGLNIRYDSNASVHGSPLFAKIGDQKFGKKTDDRGRTVTNNKEVNHHYVIRDKSYLAIIKELSINSGFAVNTCCNTIHIGIPRTHATEWIFVQKSGATSYEQQDFGGKKVNMTGFVFRKGSLMKNGQKVLVIIEYTRQNPARTVVKGGKTVQVQDFPKKRFEIWPPGANTQYHGAEDQFVYRTRIDGVISNDRKESQLKDIAKFIAIRLKRASETASFTIPMANPFLLPNHRAKFAGKQVEFLKKNKYRVQSINETFDENGWEQAVEVELDIWNSGEFNSVAPTLRALEQNAVNDQKAIKNGRQP